MKTVLMTGGTGYLGSYLLRYLLGKDYKIILIKRSFSNTERIADLMDKIILIDIDIYSCSEAFNTNHIDIILHCATDYGCKNKESSQIIEANLMLPLQLLEAGAKKGTRCSINTDTIFNKRINEYTSFNTGGGIKNSLSLLELFIFLENELHIKMKYAGIEPRVSDQNVFVADIRKAEKLLGCSPKISKETCLRKTLEWLMSNEK